MALQWKNHNIVTMLLTIHTATMDKDKPSVAGDDINMKVVNVGDHIASYYMIGSRSKIW